MYFTTTPGYIFQIELHQNILSHRFFPQCDVNIHGEMESMFPPLVSGQACHFGRSDKMSSKFPYELIKGDLW